MAITGSALGARPFPLRVGLAGWIVSELFADPGLPIRGTLDQEVVVVLVKGDDELVEEAFRAQDALKRHLKRGVFDERDVRIPGALRVRHQGEMDVLKLDSPVTAEDPQPSDVSSCTSDSNSHSVCRTAVKEGDRGAGIEQCT